MATFEGPMLSIKSVNALSHYTDWTIAHVHVAALGWNGFLTFAVLYWLIPRIFNTELYSKKLANAHFWIGFLGILVYALPLYFAGIVQGLMWKQFNADGFLVYPNFLETVIEIVPYYMIRAVGGGMFLIGTLMMGYNLIRTMKAGKVIDNEPAQAPALEKKYESPKDHKEHWHRLLERKPVQFIGLSLIAILIGGMVEMIPAFLISSNRPTIASVKPYTPLELEGRDIYVAEGCHNCHSQMIRPFRSETERYGEYSKAGEYVYDHPFQWGSKRTGPDLMRVGNKYPDGWHYRHMVDPTSMSPGSIMPPYPWLAEQDYDKSMISKKIRAMQKLGVPYPAGYDLKALDDMMAQADTVVANLADNKIKIDRDKKIIALIAYLQRLGTDIKAEKEITDGN
jgi:cytochrome c oxidase cbb3-type subunit I/II